LTGLNELGGYINLHSPITNKYQATITLKGPLALSHLKLINSWLECLPGTPEKFMAAANIKNHISQSP
jgi:hypothetical protein